MAWRIHDSVIRGEIDNRERGIVRGMLWLQGLAEPVTLTLKGNAAPDLAGCLLTFENPGEKAPVRADAILAQVQNGTIGDLTASRKVRIFDLPFEEAYERRKKNQPVPEHTANSLYLEWFSEANGRVVIESADFQLRISTPIWRLTPEEEQQRRKEASAGFDGFLQKLTQAIEAQRHEPPEDKEWDEFDYEKFMRECDARTDKYAELLDKYIDHPDRDHIIAKEMGWTWLEEAIEDEAEIDGEPAKTQEDSQAEDAVDSFDGEAAEDSEWDDPFEEANGISPLEPDPATEGVDWVRKPDGYIGHPLALRALEGSLAFWNRLEKVGLAKINDPDLVALASEYQITGAKLAGALDSLAYGRELCEGAFIVAYLKRALSHVHGALAALEKVSPKNLLPAEAVSSLRAEFFGIRDEILQLMQEFRRLP